MLDADASLRFAVGDVVQCMTADGRWARGEVVQLMYRDKSMSPGLVAPYRVRFYKDGELRPVEYDDDEYVRKPGRGGRAGKHTHGHTHSHTHNHSH